MDVSTCSYNTLIIHPDDSLHAPMNRLTGDHQYVQDVTTKKDRPHSYGEQGMQEITEIPDDYLNQSHVLKHLAKEMKIPSNRQRTSSRECSLLESDEKHPPKYEQWMMMAEQNEQNNNKIKSKSQPDLTKYLFNFIFFHLSNILTIAFLTFLIKNSNSICFADYPKTISMQWKLLLKKIIYSNSNYKIVSQK